MELTTDAGSNNVVECSHDGKSETGMFGFYLCCILSVYLLVHNVVLIAMFSRQYCLCRNMAVVPVDDRNAHSHGT